MHACTCTHTQAHMYTCTQNMHALSLTHTHTHTHTHTQHPNISMCDVSVLNNASEEPQPDVYSPANVLTAMERKGWVISPGQQVCGSVLSIQFSRVVGLWYPAKTFGTTHPFLSEMSPNCSLSKKSSSVCLTENGSLLCQVESSAASGTICCVFCLSLIHI